MTNESNSLLVKSDDEESVQMGLFEKYLTLWILSFMAVGLLIGWLFPGFALTLAGLQFAGFSIPIAICLFFMMFPTLINIEYGEIKNAIRYPKPLIITLIANWIINPFLGFFLASTILAANPGYAIGVILLAVSPCTAMVLFWNKFGKGNINLGLVITSINSVLILLLYAPLASFFIGFYVSVPFITLLFGTMFFLVLPLLTGIIVKRHVYNTRGQDWYLSNFKPVLDKIAIIALLITLIVLFSLQGQVILTQPLDVLWISSVLLLNYAFMFTSVFLVCYKLNFTYKQTVTTTIIASSSHFEIAIATAILLFGPGSTAAFATVIGVLWEVPLMVAFIKLALRLKPKLWSEPINTITS
ncbi:MAG: ACR3 family arsenite efflux transporter [Candidatus Hermodarchaeota archaeon]